jgi:hypothetical protein
MEIESDDILRTIRKQMEDIASAMLSGVSSWDEYQKLVGQAHILENMSNEIREFVRRRQEVMEQ